MQRKEERRGNDAMQDEGRMKREVCNDPLLSRNSALQVAECCSEGGKNVALIAQPQRGSGMVHAGAARCRLTDDTMLASVDACCVVHGPGECEQYA